MQSMEVSLKSRKAEDRMRFFRDCGVAHLCPLRRRFLVRAMFLLSAALLITPAAAQEWTRFRGPDGSGISTATTIPVRWSEADYNWKIELPGTGHSSPVLWGDKVFVSCADKDSADRIVLCITSSEGKALWRYAIPAKPSKIHRFNSQASSSPAVDSRHVYICSMSPDAYLVIALDHHGREVWRRDFGPFASQHGHGASPIVYGDQLIVSNDQDGKSFIISLDTQTGETRWKLDRPNMPEGAAFSTPGIRKRPGAGEEILLMSRTAGMWGVDPAAGTVNWKLENVFDKRTVSSPVVAGPLVIGTCGSGGGGHYLVAVRPEGRKDGGPELAYKITRSAPYVPTSIYRDGLLFLWNDQGVVTCLRAESGEEIWRERVKGEFFGSPVWIDGRLYCMSTDGDVVVLAAGEEFRLLARNPLGELSRSTPAVANGRMYLRTISHLFCVGPKS